MRGRHNDPVPPNPPSAAPLPAPARLQLLRGDVSAAFVLSTTTQPARFRAAPNMKPQDTLTQPLQAGGRQQGAPSPHGGPARRGCALLPREGCSKWRPGRPRPRPKGTGPASSSRCRPSSTPPTTTRRWRSGVPRPSAWPSAPSSSGSTSCSSTARARRPSS